MVGRGPTKNPRNPLIAKSKHGSCPRSCFPRRAQAGAPRPLHPRRALDLPALAYHDHLWSYLVMKQIGIAELKSKLSECLRIVQGGESIAVLDRNRAVAHIVPILERPGLRIRKPASGSPKPNKVSLPKPMHQKLDVLELLLEERQSQR
jgi:antitoxin (DNA-binding transcriptional repressor) of toxin-antitoxin stability system